MSGDPIVAYGPHPVDPETQVPLVRTESKQTHDGLTAVRAVSYDPNADPYRIGYSFEITDTSGPNIFDIWIDPAKMIGPDGFVQLMGGRIWAPSDAVADDTVDVTVVDKFGVIPDIIDGTEDSLMEHYGLPVDGSYAFEASEKFINKGQLDIGYAHGTGMEPGGNFEVMGGLFVRIIYNAEKGSAYTEKVRLNIHWAKRLS